MFMVSKDKKAIINMQQVSNIYIGADVCTIKVDYENGRGCQIGRYTSEKEALVAMEIITEKMNKGEICEVPDDDAVRERILSNTERPWHHISGKKTKGHGGS